MTGDATVLPVAGAVSVGGALGQLAAVVKVRHGEESVVQPCVTASTRHSYFVPAARPLKGKMFWPLTVPTRVLQPLPTAPR